MKYQAITTCMILIVGFRAKRCHCDQAWAEGGGFLWARVFFNGPLRACDLTCLYYLHYFFVFALMSFPLSPDFLCTALIATSFNDCLLFISQCFLGHISVFSLLPPPFTEKYYKYVWTSLEIYQWRDDQRS